MSRRVVQLTGELVEVLLKIVDRPRCSARAPRPWISFPPANGPILSSGARLPPSNPLRGPRKVLRRVPSALRCPSPPLDPPFGL